ncbi:MAG: tetrahydromethanopterin S-methyltransferase subunit E [Methanobrevibacter boviskoreani]|jgi:tetrahydromethanopterin S-methyltransferase subunit E|uniref:tetrahydromethanopterin S-methyltransferase subunit E n=1 Tax=Methanobrevibacter boviskoreani TaxID=1348249 RepID=UPI00059496E1|nr:tetrahydromethanopterin S-methyltransferase subunit E [Methanobrevibacter boviskoreani]MDD6256788.1 tetrahydromethanopterin S-methyltransferase subunit E [Methanobrevibacter boviskoreani]
MDPITLGVVALMGAAATIGGAAEDLESDVGSQSNPNSQVQLAPQMGHLHRIINKATSGEPVAYGVWCGVAGAVAFVFMSYLNVMPIVAIALGAVVGAFVHSIYTVTSHMGRIVGQSQFGQPLFMDVLTECLGPIAGHGFIATFCIVGMSYLMIIPINGSALHIFPLPILAVLWGITIGAIGSSTGDVYYGSESEYQKFAYGAGTPVAIQGDIVTKEAIGAKNSIDVVGFCSRFGGPITGLCFGLIVFLSFWITIVFGTIGGQIAGIIIVLLLIYLNYKVETYARNKFGPYEEE